MNPDVLVATGTLHLADLQQFSTVGFKLLDDPGPGTTVAVPLMGFMRFTEGAHPPTATQSPDIVIAGDVAANGLNLLTFAGASWGNTGVPAVLAWVPAATTSMQPGTNVGGGLFVFGSEDLSTFTIPGSNPTLEVTILYFVADAPVA